MVDGLAPIRRLPLCLDQMAEVKKMVGRKGRSGGSRRRSALGDTVQITVRISRQTADWLRQEAWKRTPEGRKLPDLGVFVEEIARSFRERNC